MFTTVSARDGNGNIVHYKVKGAGTQADGFEVIAASLPVVGTSTVLDLVTPDTEYAIDLTGVRLIQVSALDPDSAVEWRASLNQGVVASPTLNSAIEPKFYGKTKAFVVEAPGNDTMSGFLYVAASQTLKLYIETWKRSAT